MNAVRAALPNARLEVKGNDEYPIRVVVADGASGAVIWSADQRKLFRKYPSDREASVKGIQEAVKSYYSKQQQ